MAHECLTQLCAQGLSGADQPLQPLAFAATPAVPMPYQPFVPYPPLQPDKVSTATIPLAHTPHLPHEKVRIRRLSPGKDIASNNVTETDKKTSHNKIERRYRDKLNGELVALRDAVPATSHCPKVVDQGGCYCCFWSLLFIFPRG